MKKKVLLIIIALSIIVDADFTRDENGVITDSETNLQWQDNYINNSIKNTIWEEAINYCDSLTLNGKSDWRLPNINEFYSIINYNNKSIGDGKFINISNDEYWSSTVDPRYHDMSLLINFSSLETSMTFKTTDYKNVCCVRTKD